MSDVTSLTLTYVDSDSRRRNRARRNSLLWLCAVTAAGPLVVVLVNILI